MAKLFIFFALALTAVAVSAAPVEEQQLYELPEPEDLIPQPRLPRATCDLISAFGVADSACAVHCLAKRFKGGWCEKGVCHCRR